MTTTNTNTHRSFDPEAFVHSLGVFRDELETLLSNAAERFHRKPRWRRALDAVGRKIADHPIATTGIAIAAVGAGYVVYRIARR